MLARQLRSFAVVPFLLAAAPAAVAGQGHEGHGGHGAHDTTAAAPPRGAGSAHDHAMTEQAMAGMTTAANPHLRLTPTRPATADDRRRADSLVATLRRALEPYRDVRVAERDGYAQFLRGVKNQPLYHFTSNRRAMKAGFRFDPAQPTSLLYRKDSAGAFVLVGAMYTAPARASVEELDRRVPLSVARWHQHVNICVPTRGERQRWAERESDGRMRFGPAGAIATREACDAAGGRFLPRIFGWMVHANVYESDVWGDEHRGHAGH